MTLKKDPEHDPEKVSAGKSRISLSTSLIGIVVFCCLAFLSWQFLIAYKPAASQPTLVGSPKEPVQQSAASGRTREAAVAPAPATIHLPEPVRYVIERIDRYVFGDYLSASFSGRAVRQYVAVKYFEDTDVYRYEMNEKWAIARAGDAVLCTPYLSKGRVEWSQALQYARPQAK